MNADKAPAVQSPPAAPKASAYATIDTTTTAFARAKGGTLTFQGTGGPDVFTGGRGTNIYIGGPGADVMGSATGKDIFIYQSPADSPLAVPGGVIDQWAGDYLITGHSPTIDLTALHLTGGVVSKSTSHFTANLDRGAGFFGTASVVEQHMSSGYPKADWWRAYIDTNRDGNLDAGDMMIQGASFSRGPTFLF